MKYYLIFVAAVISLQAKCQQDQVSELLDSLTSMYAYNQISYSSPAGRHFKAGEEPVYSEEIYKKRIEQLNTYSPFTFTYNGVVRKYIDRYLKSPKSVAYILGKSKQYFPLFEKQLNRYEIPLELKNLAIVESALNPTAKSQCGAAGLWQFMYGTAKSYHLEINSLVDERFDPEKETIVACQYLKDLWQIYKDWPLVLAAYNCGPGNVNRAIKKAGKKDFWAIYDYLPKETQGYVPAFIAASYVTMYYEDHNISCPSSSFLYEELDFITVTKKCTLDQLAVATGVPVKKLHYLNPKYFVGIVPGTGDRIYLPSTEAQNSKPQEMQAQVANEIAQKANPKPLIVEKEVERKSVFGTVIPGQSTKNTTLQGFQNKVEKAGTVVAEIIAAGNYQDRVEVKLKVKQGTNIKGTVVAENDYLVGIVFLQGNSAYIKVQQLRRKNTILPVNLRGEIFLKPQGNRIYLEDGYAILFKE